MDGRFSRRGSAGELEAQPKDVQARFLRIVELIESAGLERVREPYVRHLQGPLWEYA